MKIECSWMNSIHDDVNNDDGGDVGDDTKHVIHGIVSPCNNKFHEEQSLGLLGHC